MPRRKSPVVSAACAAALLATLAAGPAAAHERRTVGRYHLTAGFGAEPAYAGEPNSVQVRIADATGNPVADATVTLKVEITHGTAPPEAAQASGGPQSLGTAIAQGLVDGMNDRAAADPAASEPAAPRQPKASGPGPSEQSPGTQPETSGQRFSSSPTTFGEVADRSASEFPARQPTGAQLAARIDREVPRLSAALAESQHHARRAQAAATQSLLTSLAAVALGALGLAVSTLALRRRR